MLENTIDSNLWNGSKSRHVQNVFCAHALNLFQKCDGFCKMESIINKFWNFYVSRGITVSKWKYADGFFLSTKIKTYKPIKKNFAQLAQTWHPNHGLELSFPELHLQWVTLAINYTWHNETDHLAYIHQNIEIPSPFLFFFLLLFYLLVCELFKWKYLRPGQLVAVIGPVGSGKVGDYNLPLYQIDCLIFFSFNVSRVLFFKQFWENFQYFVVV